MAFGTTLDRKDQVGHKKGTAEANLVLVLEVFDLSAGCGTQMLQSLLNTPHFLCQYRWYLFTFSVLHMSCFSILA